MAIIGAILGDIAGSRWEFGRPKTLKWNSIELFTDDLEKYLPEELQKIVYSDGANN